MFLADGGNSRFGTDVVVLVSWDDETVVTS
jgi:hypothetical protein